MNLSKIFGRSSDGATPQNRPSKPAIDKQAKGKSAPLFSQPVPRRQESSQSKGGHASAPPRTSKFIGSIIERAMNRMSFSSTNKTVAYESAKTEKLNVVSALTRNMTAKEAKAALDGGADPNKLIALGVSADTVQAAEGYRSHRTAKPAGDEDLMRSWRNEMAMERQAVVRPALVSTSTRQRPTAPPTAIEKDQRAGQRPRDASRPTVSKLARLDPRSGRNVMPGIRDDDNELIFGVPFLGNSRWPKRAPPEWAALPNGARRRRHPGGPNPIDSSDRELTAMIQANDPRGNVRFPDSAYAHLENQRRRAGHPIGSVFQRNQRAMPVNDEQSKRRDPNAPVSREHLPELARGRATGRDQIPPFSVLYDQTLAAWGDVVTAPHSTDSSSQRSMPSSAQERASSRTSLASDRSVENFASNQAFDLYMELARSLPVVHIQDMQDTCDAEISNRESVYAEPPAA